MTHEIPSALQAYHPGVAHICQSCGSSVVDAVITEGEPFHCLSCRGLVAPPEDELTRAALEDVPLHEAESGPTLWRLVAILTFAVGALAFVFWRR
jgi:hypothetical protein